MVSRQQRGFSGYGVCFLWLPCFGWSVCIFCTLLSVINPLCCKTFFLENVLCCVLSRSVILAFFRVYVSVAETLICINSGTSQVWEITQNEKGPSFPSVISLPILYISQPVYPALSKCFVVSFDSRLFCQYWASDLSGDRYTSCHNICFGGKQKSSFASVESVTGFHPGFYSLSF